MLVRILCIIIMLLIILGIIMCINFFVSFVIEEKEYRELKRKCRESEEEVQRKIEEWNQLWDRQREIEIWVEEALAGMRKREEEMKKDKRLDE